MMRKPSITLWRNPHTRRWYWHWKAANGALIARESQGDGYADIRDAIRGLELVTGGSLVITYRIRGATNGRMYGQGELSRVITSKHGDLAQDRIFVAVHW